MVLMSTGRPRLLDLFCGGGGASRGYHVAGFDVVGVDIVRQYEYPYTFVLANAMTYPLDGFDAVHASPPCKRYTTAGVGNRARPSLFDPHPDCLAPTLERFATLSIPWVVENVPGAPLPGAVRYCGSSFGLDVRRHRLFASNVPLTAPPCHHERQAPARYPSLENKRRKSGDRAAVVGIHGIQQYDGHYTDACNAMGIDWMEWERLTQAIPPAYTEHVGRQLLEHLASCPTTT